MTVLYIDANVFIDPDAQVEALTAVDAPVTAVTSTLTGVELARYMQRVGSSVREAEATIAAMLEEVVLVPLDAETLERAAAIESRHLGTLDAIHLASALLSGADAIATRDRQLARTCEAVGLRVV